MAKTSSSIEVHESSGMPIMLTQAIIVAAALCIGELICCPLYVTFMPQVFYPLSWGLVAMLLAVMFSYVVGFALLWCAESFAYRMKEKLQPLVYSLIGAVSFAVWTVWVILGIMNMIGGRLNVGQVSAQSTMIAVINGALLGLAAFFCASTLGKRLSKYKTAMIILGCVTVIVAIAGGFILASMMQAIHAVG